LCHLHGAHGTRLHDKAQPLDYITSLFRFYFTLPVVLGVSRVGGIWCMGVSCFNYSVVGMPTVFLTVTTVEEKTSLYTILLKQKLLQTCEMAV
jgi:hypothetical protein